MVIQKKVFGLKDLKGYDQERLYKYLKKDICHFGSKNIQNIKVALDLL